MCWNVCFSCSWSSPVTLSFILLLNSSEKREEWNRKGRGWDTVCVSTSVRVCVLGLNVRGSISKQRALAISAPYMTMLSCRPAHDLMCEQALWTFCKPTHENIYTWNLPPALSSYCSRVTCRQATKTINQVSIHIFLKCIFTRLVAFCCRGTSLLYKCDVQKYAKKRDMLVFFEWFCESYWRYRINDFPLWYMTEDKMTDAQTQALTWWFINSVL